MQLGRTKIFLVTLGSRGAFYAHRAGSRGVLPCVEGIKVVDTTAAGDTFVGYLAAEVAIHLASGSAIDDIDVPRVIDSANTAASKCVGRVGSMESIPFAFEQGSK